MRHRNYEHTTKGGGKMKGKGSMGVSGPAAKEPSHESVRINHPGKEYGAAPANKHSPVKIEKEGSHDEDYGSY